MVIEAKVQAKTIEILKKRLLEDEQFKPYPIVRDSRLDTIDSFISKATDRLYLNTRSAIEYTAEAEILLRQVAAHQGKELTEYHQYGNILILRNYLKPI